MKSSLNSGENFILFLLNVFFEKNVHHKPPLPSWTRAFGYFWEVGRRGEEQVLFENLGGGGDFGLGGEWEGLDLNSR